MRVLAPTAFASRRPHHKNSPEPSQGSNSRRVPQDIPRQPSSHSTASSGSRPSRTTVRRTVQQPQQNAVTIPPAPGPSSPSHSIHADTYQSELSGNSPLLVPFPDSHDNTPSPHPSTNTNANEASSRTQLIPHPTPLTCHSAAGTPSEHLTPRSTSNATSVIMLDVINQTTPQLRSLTQSLNGLDLRQPYLPANLYESVLRCMEAAAMLERQLSRVATGLKSTGS
jgi:hypothetical protein